MALTVEDGTGLSTAESYISVANASTYHSNRGNTAWAALASDTIREQCLRRATAYLLAVYRTRWKGVRMLSTQALDWPRAYVYLEPVVTGANQEFPNLVADNIVPTDVANACAELALRAAAGTLLADTTTRKRSVTVGPISTTYDEYSPQSPRYPLVDGMLRPYMAQASGNSVPMVRT